MSCNGDEPGGLYKDEVYQEMGEDEDKSALDILKDLADEIEKYSKEKNEEIKTLIDKKLEYLKIKIEDMSWWLECYSDFY